MDIHGQCPNRGTPPVAGQDPPQNREHCTDHHKPPDCQLCRNPEGSIEDESPIREPVLRAENQPENSKVENCMPPCKLNEIQELKRINNKAKEALIELLLAKRECNRVLNAIMHGIESSNGSSPAVHTSQLMVRINRPEQPQSLGTVLKPQKSTLYVYQATIPIMVEIEEH